MSAAIWPLALAVGIPLLRRMFGMSNRPSVSPDRARPGQSAPPAGASAPAGAATSKPPAPKPKPKRTLQLKPGTSYRATLKLSGVETLASNEQVLARIQQIVGPWQDAQAGGAGASRTVTGRYAGKARAVQLPAQVVRVEVIKPPVSVDIGPATIIVPPAPASGPAEVGPDSPADVLAAASAASATSAPLGAAAAAPSAAAAAAARKPAARKPAPKPAPKPAARKPAPKPAPKPAARKPAPKPAAASSSSSSGRSAKQAAADLYNYVVPIIRAKRGSTLGVKGSPNLTVARAQTDMGITSDGIYGTGTRQRGQQLLGKAFPPRG